MKKITTGIVALFCFLPSISFAASSATNNDNHSIPCYNGGYSFGLAGFNVKSHQNSSDLNPSANKNNAEINIVKTQALMS